MSQIATIFNNMSVFTRTRYPVVAGILAFSLGLAGPVLATTVQKHHTSHAKPAHSRHAGVHHTAYSHTRHHGGSAHRHTVSLGQRVIEPQRAMEIQQALIQAHYLNGNPTGQWDPDTQAAMEKYQTDNGWQSKITPDSRALIKLGLGPKQDEGEYSENPTGVSKLTDATSADPIGAMATSEMPITSQN